MGDRVAPPAGDDVAPHRPGVLREWRRGRDTCCRCFGRGRASLSISGEEREMGKKEGGTLSVEENFRLQWRGNIDSRYEEALRQEGLDFRWRLW